MMGRRDADEAAPTTAGFGGLRRLQNWARGAIWTKAYLMSDIGVFD